MGIPEFGDHLPPEPKDISRLMELLPDKCKGCPFAQFAIMLALSKPSGIGDQWHMFEDFDANCSGLKTAAEGREVKKVLTPAGEALLSDFFDPDACGYGES